MGAKLHGGGAGSNLLGEGSSSIGAGGGVVAEGMRGAEDGGQVHREVMHAHACARINKALQEKGHHSRSSCKTASYVHTCAYLRAHTRTHAGCQQRCNETGGGEGREGSGERVARGGKATWRRSGQQPADGAAGRRACTTPRRERCGKWRIKLALEFLQDVQSYIVPVPRNATCATHQRSFVTHCIIPVAFGSD